MAKETERKFLVENDDWQTDVSEVFIISQGYLFAEKGRSLRVRSRIQVLANGKENQEYFLTLKMGFNAMTCDELEFPISAEDAEVMFKQEGIATIDKTRHIVEFENRKWEIDVFEGKHQGLIMAEIETPDAGSINKFPPWVGKEVTNDSYFKNANLAFAK